MDLSLRSNEAIRGRSDAPEHPHASLQPTGTRSRARTQIESVLTFDTARRISQFAAVKQQLWTEYEGAINRAMNCDARDHFRAAGDRR